MEKKVLARVIIEMLGAPKEHIEKTLKGYVEKLKKEQTVVKADLAPAEPHDQVFFCYAELEMRFKDLPALTDFCFDSMPSSVEIVEPAEFVFKVDKLNSLLNDLQARLHEADAIIKNERTRKQILDINALNTFRRFLLYVVEQGAKSASEISHYIGVPPKDLEPFLNKLVAEKKMKKDGEIYAIK